MKKVINVVAVKTLPDNKLRLDFNTQETKIFDMSKYLSDWPIFSRLRDEGEFAKARVDLGTVVWGRDLDIAPERLYSDGVPVE